MWYYAIFAAAAAAAAVFRRAQGFRVCAHWVADCWQELHVCCMTVCSAVVARHTCLYPFPLPRYQRPPPFTYYHYYCGLLLEHCVPVPRAVHVYCLLDVTSCLQNKILFRFLKYHRLLCCCCSTINQSVSCIGSDGVWLLAARIRNGNQLLRLH